MTEYEKMIRELPYKCDESCRSKMTENKKLIYEFNNLSPERWSETESLLKKILGKAGKSPYMEQPIHFDYGKHIEVGDYFYANYNLVILDVAPVKIGSHCMFGPNCALYTAGHPIDAEQRNTLVEYGISITIEDNVWLGGNVVVLPGVTIGKGSVIGAGSVVTKDIPSGVIAAGNPCKVIRKITEEDKKYYFKDRKF